jgi:hypothetical protein
VGRSPIRGREVRPIDVCNPQIQFSKTTARASLHSGPQLAPRGRGFPCPTLGNPLRWFELVAGELFRLLGPSFDRTSDSPSPPPRAGRLSEPMVRFGASLRDRSRLVPVRFRVVVPHFPSPESLSPSFGSPSLRESPPSARRSSSSAPKVLGFRPSATSCQFLQCSRPTGKPRGSPIPSLPFGNSGITHPKARDGQEHLLKAYPRARLPRSGPKTAALPSASGWSPIRFS